MYDLSVPIIHNGKEQNVIEKVYNVDDFPYDIMKEFKVIYKSKGKRKYRYVNEMGLCSQNNNAGVYIHFDVSFHCQIL